MHNIPIVFVVSWIVANCFFNEIDTLWHKQAIVPTLRNEYDISQVHHTQRYTTRPYWYITNRQTSTGVYVWCTKMRYILLKQTTALLLYIQRHQKLKCKHTNKLDIANTILASMLHKCCLRCNYNTLNDVKCLHTNTLHP